MVQPLPTSYLIFRAPSQAAGKCWLDALELSLRCSALLVRSVPAIDMSVVEDLGTASSTHETQWSEADYEKHFDEHGKFLGSCETMQGFGDYPRPLDLFALIITNSVPFFRSFYFSFVSEICLHLANSQSHS